MSELKQEKPMRTIKALALVSALMALPASAMALTFQDKQDISISSDGLVRTSESGTPLHVNSSNTSLSGDQVTCGTVPTGKIWHITSVGYLYKGTVTNVRVALQIDGETQDQDGAPTSSEANSFKGDWWLGAGETVEIEPHGYTDGDDLYCWANGLEYSAQ